MFHNKRDIKKGVVEVSRLIAADLNSEIPATPGAKVVEIPTFLAPSKGLDTMEVYPVSSLSTTSAFVARYKNGTLICITPNNPFLMPDVRK